MIDVISRSTFLRLTGASGAALVLVACDGHRVVKIASDGDGTGDLRPTAFVSVRSDGTAMVYVPKSEMGQGVATGLPTIAADELDMPLARVRFAFADAAPRYVYPGSTSMSTGGSTSTKTSWLPMRRAGATARAMLVQAAAERWNVAQASCTTRDGLVLHEPSGRSIAYGSLVADALRLAVPSDVPLKSPSAFRLIGKTGPRLDLQPKVEGKAIYGMDVRVPGMTYAAIARPPVFGGNVKQFDAAKARAVPGVLDVVQVPSGVAVIATNTWAAFRGKDALEISYDEGPNAGLSSEVLFAKSEALARNESQAKIAVARGSVAALKGKTLEAIYRGPFLAHAPMEPMNATAIVREDGVEVWAPTQAPTSAQAVAAKAAGVAPERVTVHVTYLGGGFGRRSQNDFVEEAVAVAKAARRPAKVVWTREDDVQHDWYRPMSVNALRGVLDANGRLTGMSHTVVSESIMSELRPNGRVENGVDRIQMDGVENMPYDVPNYTAAFVDYEHGIPVWFWRAPGANWNLFASESFVDELAHAAGRDPLAFRLDMLRHDARLTAVLHRVAELGAWGRPQAGRHQGLAISYWNGSVGALVAEVSMEHRQPNVHRVAMAVDCGRVVNPDIVVAQTQSAINYGLSAALMGKITIKDGRVEQGNFDTYEVQHMRQAPEIEIAIIPSDADPTGIGELGTPPIAPAVGNAVFAATGKRVRSLPFSDALS